LAKANGNRNPLESKLIAGEKPVLPGKIPYCRRANCSTGKNTLLEESNLFYQEKYLVAGE